MSKVRITKRMEWDMGHRLPDHKSLCRNLHGHRYVVEVTIEANVVETPGDPERGMVVDFGRLKEVISGALGYWDHGMMICIEDPWLPTLKKLDTKIIEVEFIPTAENIAQDLWRYIRHAFESQLTDCEVTVWETPTCKATARRTSR